MYVSWGLLTAAKPTLQKPLGRPYMVRGYSIFARKKCHVFAACGVSQTTIIH